MNRRREQRHPPPDILLDNLATAVLCLDADLRVTYLNPAGEILFAVSARQCAPEPIDQVLPQLSGQRERLRRALEEGAAYTERELRLHAPGGETVTVDCTATPFTDRQGRAALLVELFAQDRHLRISRDDQMRKQNLANREMLRGLAHEIKNPLGGLRGAAQLLEREIEDAGLKEYTGIIIREADRLQKLVDGMLGPRQPPDKRMLNVHEVLEHVRQLVDAELTPGITLVRDYDPSIPALAADREQLIQALLNLVVNAIQASAGKGEVTLRTRTRRLFTIGGVQHRLVARIDVIDTGAGIPEELLSRIFLPMVTSRAEGSGMGLPIAQYLVHLHGGLIECDSEPGRTQFSIFLPIGEEAGEGNDNA